MDFLDERGDTVLLLDIEFSLVLAVRDDVVAQLPAAELVQDQTFLTGVDDGAVVEFFVFFRQLLLVRKFLQRAQHVFVDRAGGIVEGKPLGDGHVVFRNAFRSALAGHDVFDVDVVPEFQKFIVSFDGV